VKPGRVGRTDLDRWTPVLLNGIYSPSGASLHDQTQAHDVLIQMRSRSCCRVATQTCSACRWSSDRRRALLAICDLSEIKAVPSRFRRMPTNHFSIWTVGATRARVTVRATERPAGDRHPAARDLASEAGWIGHRHGRVRTFVLRVKSWRAAPQRYVLSVQRPIPVTDTGRGFGSVADQRWRPRNRVSGFRSAGGRHNQDTLICCLVDQCKSDPTAEPRYDTLAYWAARFRLSPTTGPGAGSVTANGITTLRPRSGAGPAAASRR